jgi:hypothetical protein
MIPCNLNYKLALVGESTCDRLFNDMVSSFTHPTHPTYPYVSQHFSCCRSNVRKSCQLVHFIGDIIFKKNWVTVTFFVPFMNLNAVVLKVIYVQKFIHLFILIVDTTERYRVQKWQHQCCSTPE